MPSQKCAAILLLSGTLSVTHVACSQVNSLWSPKEPTVPVATTPTPSPATPSPVKPSPIATPIKQPTIDPKQAYDRAMDAAYSAETIAESAQSAGDWQLAIARWQEAIGLLKRVPSSSSYHAIAQPKIAQYQRNLGVAQQKATRPGSNAPSKTEIPLSPGAVFEPSSPSPSPTSSSKTPATSTPDATSQTKTDQKGVFKAPIKRRQRGTPVIDVIFNGTQTFEMVVDTGASGTVITQAMAKSLNIVPNGTVTANTASAKGVTFRTGIVESIAVEGAVEQKVRVAIGGAELEMGLLGQDFFSQYDVSLKQDVVEFHTR
jgi:hypothetical protein